MSYNNLNGSDRHFETKTGKTAIFIAHDGCYINCVAVYDLPYENTNRFLPSSKLVDSFSITPYAMLTHEMDGNELKTVCLVLREGKTDAEFFREVQQWIIERY